MRIWKLIVLGWRMLVNRIRYFFVLRTLARCIRKHGRHLGRLLPLLVAGCLLLAGCKVTRFSQTLPDGRVIRASDWRVFTVTTAQIEASINPTNGLIVIKVKVASRGDAAMAEAVAEGTAKGVVAGMK
jgi:hypothetical protein